MTRSARIATCCLLLGLAGCTDAPIEGLDKSLTLVVDLEGGQGDPVAVDFVWVVDNSTSMCDEQVDLASNFNTFRETLESHLALDVRVAVTTTDFQCEEDTVAGAAKGRFNTRPATIYPASCMEKESVLCATDADCDAVLGEPGSWTCLGAGLEECAVNPNGSVNTACRRRCESDADCGAGSTCLMIGADPKDWGCVGSPATQGCPETLPEFLSTADGNLDLFRCAATVGARTEKCYRYEQGLRGALASVDPHGPNAAQARRFLRDDAYLVVIVASDEDDCSTPDGVELGEDEYNTCALTPTTDQGGKLVPVADYVNRFRALKSDPSKVLVATITGDVLAPAGAPEVVPGCEGLVTDFAAGTDDAGWSAYLDCARQAYAASKTTPPVCHQKTTVCEGDNGLADLGSRYIEFAQGFGAHGRAVNICAAGGFAQALEEIADLLRDAIGSLCLPKQVVDADAVEVVRVGVDGRRTVLTAGVDYELDVRSPECPGEDGVMLPLLRFPDGHEIADGERVEVHYQGVPNPVAVLR